ncbi:MAG: type II secretion system F family protein [Pseudomonadota bacterium]
MFNKQRILVGFFEELAMLLDSGADLDHALDSLAIASHHDDFSSTIQSLRHAVRRGQTLSQSMATCPTWFDPYMLGMVDSGDSAGRLAPTLASLADQLEQSADLKARISQALIYPGVLLVTMLISLILLLGYILPSLADLFDTFNQDLPPLAGALFSVGDFLNRWAWVSTFLFSALIAVVLYAVVRSGSVGVSIKLSESLPLFRSELNKIEIARFCKTLASLLEAGLTLPNAMRVSATSLQRKAHRTALDLAIGLVQDGHLLNRALLDFDGMSAIHLSAIANGEMSGQLPVALNRLSQRLQKDFDRRIETLTALLQPVIIIFLAFVTGLVIYAVYSAMQSISVV